MNDSGELCVAADLLQECLELLVDPPAHALRTGCFDKSFPNNITCSHSLSHSLKETRYLSLDSVNALAGIGLQFIPPLVPACSLCTEAARRASAFATAHIENLALLKTKDTHFWISKRFLAEFKKKTPTCVRDGVYLDPSAPPYRNDVYCCHDALSIDTTTRTRIPAALAALFAPLPQISDEPCVRCIERNTLLQPARLKLKSFLKKPSKDGWIVPTAFLAALRAYFKNPGTPTPVLDGSVLLCPHDSLFGDHSILPDQAYDILLPILTINSQTLLHTPCNPCSSCTLDALVEYPSIPLQITKTSARTRPCLTVSASSSTTVLQLKLEVFFF